MLRRILENRKKRQQPRPTTASARGANYSTSPSPVSQTHIYQSAIYSNDDDSRNNCSSHSYSSSHSHDSGSSSGDSGGGFCD